MNFLYPTLLSAAESAHSTGVSGFNMYTYVISIINITVLFYLLKGILFKPVTSMLNERTEKIRKDIEDAKSNNEQSQKIKVEYEDKLKGLKSEGEQIIKASEEKAKVHAEQIIQDAKREANNIIQKAKEQAQIEVQSALKDVKKDVASLALQAATKVVQNNMDNEKNRKLVEQFIDEVGVA